MLVIKVVKKNVYDFQDNKEFMNFLWQNYGKTYKAFEKKAFVPL